MGGNENSPKKRALILAGGGIKVAFQAGVLQVWLDEAGLKFDLADGASGGTFNLAMYCQGMSGTQIADNWRDVDPKMGIDFNWGAYAHLFFAESLFELDGFRKNVFTAWGLNWDKIRTSNVDATFNVYNFSKHELEVITPDRMSEDFLVACVSLPMWFPPVRINGNIYVDPVYITDANLIEAIRCGADELWIIWTVSERSEWNDGFVNNYFQIIETAANGHFKRDLKRIEENNVALERGEPGEFGRPVSVKLLKEEVPLHYLINFSQDRAAEAVNLGVLKAREWCQAKGIPFTPSEGDHPVDIHRAKTRLQFTEEMKGYVGLGENDFETGFRLGKKSNTFIKFHLKIKVDGVNRFLTDPHHEARAEGYVQCEKFGGQLPVEKGIFNLFIDKDDPREKRMLYRLFFREDANQPLTLSGFKVIQDDPGLDLWSDTTTLYTRIYRGHVSTDQEMNSEIVASGIIKLHLTDLLKQLTTFQTEGPSLSDRSAALARFGGAFLGKLWDVYAPQILSSGPF